ncbi:Ubiquitin carboxyl-terminal hydrolase 31, partial [Ophiophagus hannah]
MWMGQNPPQNPCLLSHIPVSCPSPSVSTQEERTGLVGWPEGGGTMIHFPEILPDGFWWSGEGSHFAWWGSFHLCAPTPQSIVSKNALQFRGSSQHDAQEFLLWLLDRVHEDLHNLVKNSDGRASVKVRPSGFGAICSWHGCKGAPPHGERTLGGQELNSFTGLSWVVVCFACMQRQACWEADLQVFPFPQGYPCGLSLGFHTVLGAHIAESLPESLLFQPPLEEDSLIEGSLLPVNSTFVQELFQAQYRALGDGASQSQQVGLLLGCASWPALSLVQLAHPGTCRLEGRSSSETEHGWPWGGSPGSACPPSNRMGYSWVEKEASVWKYWYKRNGGVGAALASPPNPSLALKEAFPVPRSSLTCPHCQKQSNTFDPFLCISLPIPLPHTRYVCRAEINRQFLQTRRKKPSKSSSGGTEERELGGQRDGTLSASCCQGSGTGSETHRSLSPLTLVFPPAPPGCIIVHILQGDTSIAQSHQSYSPVRILRGRNFRKCSHCMRIGVAVPLSGTVAQLREAVARETKIPAKQVSEGGGYLGVSLSQLDCSPLSVEPPVGEQMLRAASLPFLPAQEEEGSSECFPGDEQHSQIIRRSPFISSNFAPNVLVTFWAGEKLPGTAFGCRDSTTLLSSLFLPACPRMKRGMDLGLPLNSLSLTLPFPCSSQLDCVPLHGAFTAFMSGAIQDSP